MPLLVCPNDNASMQSVSRSGVEFDFCPTCRGVWLDRGELEKLMEAGRGAAAGPPPGQSRPPESGHRPQPQAQYDDPRYRRDHDDNDHGQRRKKRGFDLFDIFD